MLHSHLVPHLDVLYGGVGAVGEGELDGDHLGREDGDGACEAVRDAQATPGDAIQQLPLRLRRVRGAHYLWKTTILIAVKDKQAPSVLVCPRCSISGVAVR